MSERILISSTDEPRCAVCGEDRSWSAQRWYQNKCYCPKHAPLRHRLWRLRAHVWAWRNGYKLAD